MNLYLVFGAIYFRGKYADDFEVSKTHKILYKGTLSMLQG